MNVYSSNKRKPFNMSLNRVNIKVKTGDIKQKDIKKITRKI